MILPTTILLTIFLVLSGIHVYWAFGGTAGVEGAIPYKDGKPLFEAGMIGTLAVAIALLFAALLIAWKGYLPQSGPNWIADYGVWFLAVIFALRAVGDFKYAGFFKKVRGTRFARNDSWIFSPLCIMISGLLLWLALSS